MKKILYILCALSFSLAFDIGPQGWFSISSINNNIKENSIQYSGGIGWYFNKDRYSTRLHLGFGYFKPTFDAMFISSELKGGYYISKNIDIYGLIGYRMVSYDNRVPNSEGIGYGFGSSYDINKNWKIETEYKYYDLSHNDSENIIEMKFVYSL